MQAVSLSKQMPIIHNLRVFAQDIKLSHSIFAMPFVGVALTLTGVQGITFLKIIKIVFCMITARSFAMGMNRYLDREFDASNQRTKSRALPAGSLNPSNYLAITVGFGLLFVVLAFSLSSFAGFLSPLLLAVLGFYSLMKRLSWLTHWYLGICLGLAPVAAQLALFDEITPPILVLAIAISTWTAGFDLLYSLQDKQFDRDQGLHSAPAKFGHRTAIWLSRGSFLVMILSLIWVGQMSSVSWAWYVGVGVVATILTAEHWIIRDAMVAGTSNKINVAFFNLNALVSVLFFIFAVVDIYVRS